MTIKSCWLSGVTLPNMLINRVINNCRLKSVPSKVSSHLLLKPLRKMKCIQDKFRIVAYIKGINSLISLNHSTIA